jgi:hypothetical protein
VAFVFKLLLAVLAVWTTTNNQLVAWKVWLTGTTLSLTPWGNWVTATRGTTFTTTVWVINRVHSNTTNGWADTLPTHTAGLTPVDVRLLSVTYFTNGGAATSVYVTDFTRW